jgi:23S rRNA (cytidine2498-2'-O)-methyltransferase
MQLRSMERGSAFIVSTSAGFERSAKREIQSLIPEAKVQTLFLKGNLWVKCPQGENDIVTRLREASTTYIGRIFPVDEKVKISSSNESVPILCRRVQLLDKLKTGDTFIVNCNRRGTHDFSSKDVERGLGAFLERETGATANFKSPEKTVVVQIFQDIAFIGVTKTENLLKKAIGVFRKYPPGERPFTRAEMKIREAIEVFNVKIHPDFEILDVGAAPGGWTKILSNLGKRVVAVDPADLHPSVASLPNVTHLKCRAEEIPRPLGLFHMLTNDINVEPSESARIMIGLADLLRKDGIAMMTVKFVTRNRKRHVQEAIRILEEKYVDFKVKKLPHNRYETTISMRAR